MSKILESKDKNRILSIIVFSLFFSWLLAFPFEGRILYSFVHYYGISSDLLVFGSMIAHFIGLLISGLFIKNIGAARNILLFSIIVSILTSIIFLSSPSILWYLSLWLSSFLVGVCVSAWSFYLKEFTIKSERIKTIADGLIFSNILMIFLNFITTYNSYKEGLLTSIAVLLLAFLFALRLPNSTENISNNLFSETNKAVSIKKPLTLLYIFIFIITINSGLMYHVTGPAFSHLEDLTTWYWAIPYITALIIMRNLSRRANRTYMLYVAIAMIGFSFILFLILDYSWISYIIVDTLMLGAFGVYDLFWWSILGEMLDLSENPAKILGIGLSANVIGIIFGGLVGDRIVLLTGVGQNPTLLALGVVCITLVILPPLHKRLTLVLEDHIYLTTYIKLEIEQKALEPFSINEEFMLTEREGEIAALLIRGLTYKMIGQELFVSENTVKTHVKNIYSKTGVQNRAELINLFIEKY